MNDENIYREVLSEYAVESGSKMENIKKYYKEKDWKNYSIFVHSLKSSSKTIGAQRLSDIAATLEKASKECNVVVIDKNHLRALEMYDKVVETIRKNINIVESIKPEEDDEILEFSPIDNG